MTLLTTEAEYIAVVEASKEALWLRGLVKIFSIIQDSVQVHYDRVLFILLKNHRYHKRTKYNDVRYHKIRQKVVDDKVIDLVKISTKLIPADMMIKIITMEKFKASLNFIQVLQR